MPLQITPEQLLEKGFVKYEFEENPSSDFQHPKKIDWIFWELKNLIFK